jgi:hypothetical protein
MSLETMLDLLLVAFFLLGCAAMWLTWFVAKEYDRK